jgi:hypothetical protein
MALLILFTSLLCNFSGIIVGLIRNDKHLKEVLGLRGQDLVDPQKLSEMILFIAKHRLFLIDRKAIQADASEHESESLYRVRFETDRMYTADKVR